MVLHYCHYKDTYLHTGCCFLSLKRAQDTVSLGQETKHTKLSTLYLGHAVRARVCVFVCMCEHAYVCLCVFFFLERKRARARDTQYIIRLAFDPVHHCN